MGQAAGMVPLRAGPDRLKPIQLRGLAVFARGPGALGGEFVGLSLGGEVAASKEAVVRPIGRRGCVGISHGVAGVGIARRWIGCRGPAGGAIEDRQGDSRRFIRLLLLLGGDRDGITVGGHGVNIGLFDKRQHAEGPAAGLGFSEAAVGIARPAPAPAGRWKGAVLV